MNIRICSFVFICLAFFGSFSVAQAAKDSLPAIATVEDYRGIITFNRERFLVSPTPHHCVPPTDCPLQAKVNELFDKDGNLTSCLVKAENIKIKYGPNPKPNAKIKVAWNLDTSGLGPTPARYKFEGKYAVLIIRDKNRSTKGLSDRTSDTQASLDHKFVATDDEVEFYPLVIQTISGKPDLLCSAADPIINND